MKKISLITALAFLSLLPLLTIAQSQQAAVKITGEVATPLTINNEDLQKFNQTTVVRKDRDGKDHTYSGVPVADLLQKAGVTMGPELKGENLTKYLLVDASDGYQVTFALAELDKSYTDRVIILANQVDGKPLLPADGPFRIIVQDEKKPARCIKQVVSFKIAFAK
ncbi:molybdopterin-dependent oxidoreductase [Mucilaginibacter dorajii]|uniref:Oxidoreductase molybdopterin-binding domain-containing protein n=1 Tax=Mucilaginibacter dorajii TaxID=692994 RepID=A0ABP7R1B6_9SPHI|nr:molybdopterin-dependent oxidoreductase [Mucilaginibacter dorajii]MCS3732105.1 DMSO/TMAO reductase YedYZ molybdopterin-dependent catalytic subunit [Mucilaginibacter dorajii]